MVFVPRSTAFGLVGLGEVARVVGLLHHGTAVHYCVLDLGGRKRVFLVRHLNRHVVDVVARGAVLHGGPAKYVGANGHGFALSRLQVLAIFTRGIGGLANVLSAVTSTIPKSDANRPWRLAWLHEGWQFNGLTVHSHLDHGRLVALRDVSVQTHRLHVRAGHGHVVVPRHFGNGVRRFLQHGVAGLVARTHGLFLVQRQLHATSFHGLESSKRRGNVQAEGHRRVRHVASCHVEAVVQCAVPVRIVVHPCAGVAWVVGQTHEVVARNRLTCPSHEALARCAGVKKRLNGRLTQINSGATDAQVHPAFQPMVVGSHGRAARCGLVRQTCRAQAEWHLRQAGAESILLGGVVRWVGSVQNQCRHVTLVHVCHKLSKCLVVASKQALSVVFDGGAIGT